MRDIEIASSGVTLRAFVSVILRRKWAILALYFALLV